MTTLSDAIIEALHGWQPIATAPKDGTEIMLHYFDFLGEPMTVSGHWRTVAGREWEDTWEHSLGYGDADLWMPLPAPPTAPQSSTLSPLPAAPYPDEQQLPYSNRAPGPSDEQARGR